MRTDKSRDCAESPDDVRDSTRKRNGWGRGGSLNHPSSGAASKIHCYDFGGNQPVYATSVISFTVILAQINSFP